MARKKQKRITAVTLAILSGLNGCGSADVSKDYEDYTITKEQYVSEYTEQFDYLEVVTVEYPILSGLGREQEENINKILYDMAMEKVDYWHLTPNEEVKALQKEYSIYSSDVHCDINFHSQYLLSISVKHMPPLSPYPMCRRHSAVPISISPQGNNICLLTSFKLMMISWLSGVSR